MQAHDLARSLQPDLAKHAVESARGRAWDGNIETTGGFPISADKARKDLELPPSVRSIYVLIGFCFAECEFARAFSDATRIGSDTRKFWRKW